VANNIGWHMLQEYDKHWTVKWKVIVYNFREQHHHKSWITVCVGMVIMIREEHDNNVIIITINDMKISKIIVNDDNCYEITKLLMTIKKKSI